MNDIKIKKEEELVTIGILCYNAVNTIEKAIESAINQTYINKEIIVIDDFSTDKSFECIKSSKYSKYISIYRNKDNKGAAYSRNKILRMGKGQFICFMDDDDLSNKNRVSLQVESIKKAGYPTNKFIISTCSILRKYESGYNSWMTSMGNKGRLPIKNELANYLLFYERENNVDYGFGCPTCSLLATKDSFEKIGGFDENLRRVEDMDITIRFSQENMIFTSVRDYLVTQYSTKGSDKTPLKNLISEIEIIKKNKSYLSKKKVYIYSRLWPYLRYYYFKKKYIYLFFTMLVIFTLYPLRAFPHFLKTSRARFIHDRKIKKGI